MLNDVLSERLGMLEYAVQADTTPAEMLALANYIDDEATVLACIDELGGTGEERQRKLVYGMAHIMGVPWVDDKQVPVLGDDLSTEQARNYLRGTAFLLEVVEDHARCIARVEANHVVSALIRGHLTAAGS